MQTLHRCMDRIATKETPTTQCFASSYKKLSVPLMLVYAFVCAELTIVIAKQSIAVMVHSNGHAICITNSPSPEQFKLDHMTGIAHQKQTNMVTFWMDLDNNSLVLQCWICRQTVKIISFHCLSNTNHSMISLALYQLI